MTTQEIWQLQALEAPRVSAAYMRHRASDLARRTQIRNGLNYAIAVPGVIYLAWCCWTGYFAPPGDGDGARAHLAAPRICHLSFASSRVRGAGPGGRRECSIP